MPQHDRLFQLLSQMETLELEQSWSSLKKGGDSSFSNFSRQEKINLISKELRSVSGHSLVNVFRDEHAMPWKQILIDTADKLKPGLGWTYHTLNDKSTEEEIEKKILIYLDDMIKSSWEKSSQADKDTLSNSLTTVLQQAAEQEAIQKQKIGQVAIQTVTAQTLGNAISNGLFIGGGMRMLIAKTSIGVVGSAFGANFLSQLGIWFVVQFFGWWAGLKLIIGGGAAKLGVAIIGTPLIVIGLANTAMSPSYTKSIPTVISILVSHQFREVKF
jgi:hypothetical protein